MTETRGNNLITRIVSALVLIPPVLGATYLGFPYFNILVAVAVAVMAWEWGRLVNDGRFGYEGWLLGTGLLAAVVAISMGAYPQAFLGLGVIGVLFFNITAARRLLFGNSTYSSEMDQELAPRRSMWMAAGALYIGVPSLSLVWIRTDWDNGMTAVMWLLALVWAADSGAYAAGRLIGGPKLAPGISPKKTWAGLGGAVFAAAAVGAVIARMNGLAGPAAVTAIALGALIGFISQAGDLVESALKRHFKVKDSSNIIPGHGGLLDRLDGLLAAITAAALIGVLSS